MTTGRDLCRRAEAELAGAGVPDPARDVQHLFLHALGQAGMPVARHHLAEYLTRPVPEAVAQVFADLITARALRQPVSQLTGRRAFWMHEFRVTPDVLDPRPETETLVAAALQLPWRSVLDLGTGSGAILISLLAARPGATGLGTDISAAALAVAQHNASDAGVVARFLESDWFAAVDGCFDLIVANPPYIAAAEMPELAPEVREWEPHLALTDGGDGLSAYRAICRNAPAHLSPDGSLLVEIGPTQGAAVADMMRRAGLAEVRVLPDLDHRDRAVCGKLAQKRQD